MDANKEKLYIRAYAGYCIIGILSDPEELPRVKRNGKKMSCTDSVSALAVRQAKSIVRELKRQKCV